MHTYIHTYLHTTEYVCAWIHTCWNIIKQLLNSKGDTGLPDIFLIDGTEIKDALFIAETFNSYFTNPGPAFGRKILISLNRMMPLCLTLHLVHLVYTNLLLGNNTDISSLILKNSTSPGIDGINPSIARSLIFLVATPLSWIFNFSLNLGLIPDSLKIAKITPIFKSCSKNLISNYRPSSVLSYFSKILEKLMVTRLSTYLVRFALLSTAKFSFQHGKSTYMYNRTRPYWRCKPA